MKSIEDTVIETEAQKGNAAGGLFIHGTFKKYFFFVVPRLAFAVPDQAETAEDAAQAIRDSFNDCGKLIADELLRTFPEL